MLIAWSEEKYVFSGTILEYTHSVVITDQNVINIINILD